MKLECIDACTYEVQDGEVYPVVVLVGGLKPGRRENISVQELTFAATSGVEITDKVAVSTGSFITSTPQSRDKGVC